MVRYLIIRRLDVLESSYRIEDSYDDYDTAIADMKLLMKVSKNEDYIFDIYVRIREYTADDLGISEEV